MENHSMKITIMEGISFDIRMKQQFILSVDSPNLSDNQDLWIIHTVYIEHRRRTLIDV